MPRDINPLVNALEETTPRNQTDVYTLLAAWNRSVKTALERGGGSRYREVTKDRRAKVIDLVDTATTDEKSETDWAFLQECADAYPPGIGDHHCSQILANVVARYVIRTRINQEPDAIPPWVVDYLMEITIDADTEWAWESAAAVGWAVGHSDSAVLDQVVERTDTKREPWAMGILKHVSFADPDAGITLLKRLLQSPNTREDLTFLRSLERPLKQDLPNFPQYWEPQKELDYEVSFTNEQMDRLLEVLGEAIHPKRLENFDEQFAFDLERAGDEYSTADRE